MQQVVIPQHWSVKWKLARPDEIVLTEKSIIVSEKRWLRFFRRDLDTTFPLVETSVSKVNPGLLSIILGRRTLKLNRGGKDYILKHYPKETYDIIKTYL